MDGTQLGSYNPVITGKVYFSSLKKKMKASEVEKSRFQFHLIL